MIASIIVSTCATPYQRQGFFTRSGIDGGFSEERLKSLGDNIYRVSFRGTQYSTKETVQTYWLYRCAELTLELGYEGFEILSPVQLTGSELDARSLVQKVQVIFIPMAAPPTVDFVADIKLLKQPFTHMPPRTFDATILKSQLEPYVNAEEKCDKGNVCPHLHDYLRPIPSEGM